MLGMLILLSGFLTGANSGTTLIYYKFYDDSGSTFADYSSFGNTGVSTLDGSSNPTVILSANKGATLDGSSSYIILPPNSSSVGTVSIPESFYLVGWFFLRSHGPLFYRKSGSNELIKLSVTSTNLVELTIVGDSSYSTFSVDTSDSNNGLFVSPSYYVELNKWIYLELEILRYIFFGDNMNIEIWNTGTKMLERSIYGEVYHDIASGSEMHIGYDGSNYLNADVFMFRLYDGADFSENIAITTCNGNECSSCSGSLVCSCSNGASNTSCSCDTGYWDNGGTCELCSPSQCTACDSSGDCTACSNNAGNTADCTCSSTQWDNAGTCTDCVPSLCTSCDSSGVCTACSNNAGSPADCSCATYQGFDGTNCVNCISTLCTSCDSSTVCSACSNNAGNPNDCTCAAYQGFDGANCVNCISTLCTSCDSSGACSVCSNNPGNPNDCTCAAYQGFDGTNCVDCLSTSCTSCSSFGVCSACSNNAGNLNDCTCASNQWFDGTNCVDCAPVLCTTCSSAGVCTACSNNAGNPTDCTCSSTQWDDSGTCTDCTPAECTSCDSSGNCTACSNNAGNVTDCTCSSTQWDDSGTCTDCIPADCTSCDCYECACTDCENTPVLGNNPIVCQICNNGYFLNNGLCSSCPHNCSICTSQEHCTVCSGYFQVLQGLCYCLDGYFLKEGECLECDDLCQKCNQSACTECKSPFLIHNGSCVCPPNHELIEDSCVLSPLSYSIVLESYYIFIQFSESLNSSLTSENIKKSCFLPEEKQFELVIESVNLSSYVLRIKQTSIPSPANAIQIEFSSVYASSGKTLDQTNETAILQISENQIQDIMKSQDSSDFEGISEENTAQATSISAAASTIGVTLISGNPSSLWTFLNFIVLIYYMPLQNVGMPVRTKKLFGSFSLDLIDMIPSSDAISNSTSSLSSSSSRAPEMWADYGISSTDLLYNNRSFLILLGLGIGLFVVLGLILILWRKGKYRDKVYNVFKELRWSYFLRIYIQYYIKIVLSCLLALGTISTGHYKVPQFLAIILYLFCGLCVLFIVLGTYKKREIIQEQSLEKFGSFYEEFKCDKGFMSMVYYPLFLVRRYVYVSGLYFLERFPVFQVCVNSLFSFVVVIYLLYFRPFKETSLNVINIWLESIISVMFVCSGLFLLEIEEEEKIERAMFVLSILAIVIFAFLMFHKLFLALKGFRGKKGKEGGGEGEGEGEGIEKEGDSAFNTIIVFTNQEGVQRESQMIQT